MNKTLLAAIIVIIVIAGGIFLFAGRSSVPVVNETVNENKLMVTYTDSGFSPQTITVKKGGTVTFINQSSGGMWVASNPHPTHTDYPAFDEKASVGSGGSWSFTFDQVGSWGYHNHRNPSNLGTVIVEQ